jgi:hypothetical protein
MLTSLEQLFNKHDVERVQRHVIKTICKPQQKDFLSFVQSFIEQSMLPNQFKIEDYNLDHRLVPYGHNVYGIYHKVGYRLYSNSGSLNSTFDESREQYKHPLFIVKFNKEEYITSKNQYDNFWEWRKNRNPDRLKMEEEFFFDGKHAMHLVRLLRMGVEALTEGKIIVRRPDAEELLQIRAGAWTYEQVVAYAEETDRYVREDLYLKTKLPKTPNIKLAAQLILEVQDLIWNQNNNNER